MKGWQIIAVCNTCGAEKIKRKSEYNKDTYLCITCFRKKRGKELGKEYGKKQEYRGKCQGCNSALPTSRKWCDNCSDKKQEHLTKIRSGANNPAWTGKHVCECGAKKSHGAVKCKKCSFSSGDRSGENNGRYIKENREYYLQCVKSRKTLSGLMNNVCKQLGVVKSRQKTSDLLGYTWNEFKEHIEGQFQPGMTWENHGEWHVDHITPVSAFIDSGSYDIKLVNTLSNLQPLWAKDNMQKSDNFTKTKLLLIIGPSGSGKTSLVKKIDSPLVVDGDEVKPDELVYLALNKPHVAYTLTIGISTFIKRFSNLYDIKTVAIDITAEDLENNLISRGSKLSKRTRDRKKYIDEFDADYRLSISDIENKVLKLLTES